MPSEPSSEVDSTGAMVISGCIDGGGAEGPPDFTGPPSSEGETGKDAHKPNDTAYAHCGMDVTYPASWPSEKMPLVTTYPQESQRTDYGIKPRACLSQNPQYYVLLAFNTDYAALASKHPGDQTMPKWIFEDGSGFVKVYSSFEHLNSDTLRMDPSLLVPHSNTIFGQSREYPSLGPLLVVTDYKAINFMARMLGCQLNDRPKEVAMSAILRKSDWFIQTVPDWPLTSYGTKERMACLKGIIEYVGMTLLSSEVRDRISDPRKLFRIIEVSGSSSSAVVALVRLAPEVEHEHWASEVMTREMTLEARRPHGFRIHGFCHFVRPACPETLSASTVSKSFAPITAKYEPLLVTDGGETRSDTTSSHCMISAPGDSSHTTVSSPHSRFTDRRAMFATAVTQNRPTTIQSCSFSMARPISHVTAGINCRATMDMSFGRSNGIDTDRIYRGLDVRTTIMLRNLPNRLTHEDLHDYLLSACPGEFDFLYVRIDFSNGCNVGYGFVNLTSPQSVIGFVEKFRGFRWPGSEKVAEVSYATQQGREALISRFRNSSVMTKGEASRPKLYYPLGHPLAGMEEPFPEPDNLAKLQRSQQNADTEGLYETRGRRNGLNVLRHRSGIHDPQITHHASQFKLHISAGHPQSRV